MIFFFTNQSEVCFFLSCINKVCCAQKLCQTNSSGPDFWFLSNDCSPPVSFCIREIKISVCCITLLCHISRTRLNAQISLLGVYMGDTCDIVTQPFLSSDILTQPLKKWQTFKEILLFCDTQLVGNYWSGTFIFFFFFFFFWHTHMTQQLLLLVCITINRQVQVLTPETFKQGEAMFSLIWHLLAFFGQYQNQSIRWMCNTMRWTKCDMQGRKCA